MEVYLSAHERRLVFEKVGDIACWLFTAYLEKAGTPGFDYNDEAMSHYLDWKVSKVKRCRHLLINAGLFRQEQIADYVKKKKVVYTYLGESISKDPVVNKHLTDTIKYKD